MDRTSEYLTTLASEEKVALSIAKEQLGSSFCLVKSLGYLAWLEKNPMSIYDESSTKKKKKRIRIKGRNRVIRRSTRGESGGGNAAEASYKT